MADGPMQVAVGAILLVLAGAIIFIALPILDGAISDYADGPDDTPDTADDPSAGVVTLAELSPLTIVAVLVFAGVQQIVRGARGLNA